MSLISSENILNMFRQLIHLVYVCVCSKHRDVSVCIVVQMRARCRLRADRFLS